MGAQISIHSLAAMNLVNSEVHRKNLDCTEGEYQPTANDTAKQILMNQQIIMLMLIDTKYGSAEATRIQETLENRVKYENDRWVFGN